MKKIMITIMVLGLVFLTACVSKFPSEVTNFEECVEAGNAIMESYPQQCMHDGETFVEEIVEEPLPTLASLCEKRDGTWIEEAMECEYISKEACENLGGEFNECASACRNDPDAEICTMQCVLVCEFGSEPEMPVIPEGCTSWFDGCNTCMVSDGELGGCTRMACTQETLEEPECLQFEE